MCYRLSSSVILLKCTACKTQARVMKCMRSQESRVQVSIPRPAGNQPCDLDQLPSMGCSSLIYNRRKLDKISDSQTWMTVRVILDDF